MQIPSVSYLADNAYDRGVEFDPAFMPTPGQVAEWNAVHGRCADGGDLDDLSDLMIDEVGTSAVA